MATKKQARKRKTKAADQDQRYVVSLETIPLAAAESMAELGMLAQGRRGPIQVTMCHPNRPSNPENPAAAAQAGQDTTDQSIAGQGRRYAVGGVSFERNSHTDIVNLCSPPKPVGEVPAKVEELVLALEGLEKSVAILQDKLDPMLQPGQASAGGTNAAQTEPVGGTIIGERLRQAVAMVVALRRRVADITERTAL